MILDRLRVWSLQEEAPIWTAPGPGRSFFSSQRCARGRARSKGALFDGHCMPEDVVLIVFE
jgi:hypothetical protein